MRYAVVPDNNCLKSKNELYIENETIKVDFASVNTREVIDAFFQKTKGQREKSVISSAPFDLDYELAGLLENFINSSGGSYSLVSAQELNEEPKCLLSGDFLCSEVVAKNATEVIEYFKQAMRTRESLGINIPALLSLHRNGCTLNFIICPSNLPVRNPNIHSKSFLLLLTASNLDLNLFRLANQIESRADKKRVTSKSIRQELNTLNRDIIRQTKPDNNQRDELLKLLKTLNYAKEHDPEIRLSKAKSFMEQREGILKENGLLWSLNEEVNDMNIKLSLEYQKLRRDVEEARLKVGRLRDEDDKAVVKNTIVRLRKKESLLAACEAKISNSTVVALHHQLKGSRDQLRMEQIEKVKLAKASGAKDNEILVNYVESQKRLIERLEDDVEVIVQQHEHFMEQLKLKQISVIQKYRDLMEGAASDRIYRLESLLHETMSEIIK